MCPSMSVCSYSFFGVSGQMHVHRSNPCGLSVHAMCLCPCIFAQLHVPTCVCECTEFFWFICYMKLPTLSASRPSSVMLRHGTRALCLSCTPAGVAEVSAPSFKTVLPNPSSHWKYDLISKKYLEEQPEYNTDVPCVSGCAVRTNSSKMMNCHTSSQLTLKCHSRQLIHGW